MTAFCDNGCASAHSSSDSVSGRGMNTPGPTLHGHRAERRGAGQVLQRDPLRALGDEAVVPVEEIGLGVGEGQASAVGARGVGGEEFGVGARRSDARLGQRHRGGVDDLAQPGHACCSLVCLSAAASASNSGSRSPSRTWSRLCALKLIR